MCMSVGFPYEVQDVTITTHTQRADYNKRPQKHLQTAVCFGGYGGPDGSVYYSIPHVQYQIFCVLIKKM